MLSGEVITETLDYDGGRSVSVYLPATPPKAMVFAADGQATPDWAHTLEAAGATPTMLVGVHGLADESGRLAEYSPAFDLERFEAHERFVVDDVPAWVRSRLGIELPPARTAVFGASAGGELALALGLRHPDRYGAVLVGSPGAGFAPPATGLASMPRTYLVAGAQERFFLANAARWRTALREAGCEVVLKKREGTHEPSLWRAELPRMVAWAFEGS